MDKLELSFGDYCFMLDAENLTCDLPAEVSSYRRSREDGSSHSGATVPSRTLRITGSLAGSDPSDLREKRDRFIQGMYPTPRKQKLYVYSDRYYWAEVSSISLPEYDGLGYLPFTVTFLAGDPYEYADKETVAESTGTTALWTGYDALYHASVRITNPGGEALPKVKVAGLDADTADHEGCILDLRSGNLLVNPSFEQGTTGWTGGALDPFYAEDGCQSLSVTNVATAYQYVPLGSALSGLSLTASVYLLKGAAGGNTSFALVQYNAGGSVISTHTSTAHSAVTTGFVRETVTITVHSTCRYVKLVLQNTDGYSGKSYFDAAQLEIGATPTAYKPGVRRLTTYSGALTASDTLVVNAAAKTVKKGTTSMLSEWAGDFPRLSHGDNLLILSHEDSASTYTLGTAYRPRYL